MDGKKNAFAATAVEYDGEFWDRMRNRSRHPAYLAAGKAGDNEGYRVPPGDGNRLQGLLREEDMMRRICTVVKAYGCQYTILAKDCNDTAHWVKEAEAIPLYEGMQDFTPSAMEAHKLCSLVRLDEVFVRDATFDFRDYLLRRFAKVFGRQEEDAFLCGDGDGEPTGVLHPEYGAETALTVREVTADDIIALFFSLKPEYRRNATWVMNDATALRLRKLKDDAGNYLWRSTDDSIFGRPVMVSNFMPDAGEGAAPVVFGDFSYYWIILRGIPSFRTLAERFAPYSQVGYVGTEHFDGKLVRREAVKALRTTSA